MSKNQNNKSTNYFNRQDIFVSVDIESDGPIPGVNSMLSLGAAAFYEYELVGTFSVNLEQLEGAVVDPQTKKHFWDKNPEAWDACRTNLISPERGMRNFNTWLKQIRKNHNESKLTFAAYPAGFDFTFVYYYLVRFVGQSPFSFSALDIKTLAMAMLHKKGSGLHFYRSLSKRKMPRRWLSDKPHTHIALDDAIEQGEMLMNMLKELDQQ